MKVHGFREKLQEGEDCEKKLDAFFSKTFTIEDNPSFEKYGIDRIFTSNSTGYRYTVEYKADIRAGDTGNFFIETISVDTNNKKGWALTSCAQLIVFYIPEPERILIVEALNIRKSLKAWQLSYLEKKGRNVNYCSAGIVVPIREVESIATWGKPSIFKPRLSHF